MRSRYLYFVIASAVLLLTVALSVAFMLPRTHADVGSGSLRAAIVVVTVFLMITLLRYFALLFPLSPSMKVFARPCATC